MDKNIKGIDKMNQTDWIQKSLECVYSDGYLDKLMAIYPINKNSFRDVDEKVIKKIQSDFVNKNKIDLVKSCLSLEKFPIDNAYISILRNEEIFNRNLKVVEKIGDILLQMDFDELKTLIKAPKSGSRQYGNSFKSWLKSRYPNNFLCYDKFENYQGAELKFLEGSDKVLGEYISKNFSINTEKGLDLVFKNNKKTYFGEAKFITYSGGTQTNQLNIALDIAKKNNESVGSIAIIDGYPWVHDPDLNKIKKEAINMNVLTALLLPEYILTL